MSKQHDPVKIMRGPLTGVWYAVRERGGLVTEKWPVDAQSASELEKLYAAFHGREPSDAGGDS